MKLALASSGIIDLITGIHGLEKENTLLSAVIISLLTERRAAPDDILPADDGRKAVIPADRKGWAGDFLAEDATDRIGSRLWLLVREKQTEDTRKRAIFYIEEALQWVLDDGIATSILVEAEWSSPGRLDATVDITLIEGGLFNFSLQDVTGVISAV